MTSREVVTAEAFIELARIIEGQEDADLLDHISRVAAHLLGARQAATSLGREVAVHFVDSDASGARVAAAAAGVAVLASNESTRPGRVAVSELSSEARYREALARPRPPIGDSLVASLSDEEERVGGRIVVSDLAAGDDSREAEALLSAFARSVSAALTRRRLLASLEEAERQRQAFFGVVSHELRTPITTIYGGTRVLRRSESRMSPEARRQLLDDVAAEAERLYRLVEDLLVLSRAERDAVVVAAEPILLQHLVARVVDSERQRWPRADMRVDSPSSLPPVMGDSTLVEQVVRNLLSNAVKYAGDTGPIEVSATSSDGWVHVSVADNGPGLAADARDHVFELFYRGPDAPSQAQGAGIGLYVCRTLIEAMGGDVWVRPRSPSGSEFGFRLRAYDADPGDLPSSVASQGQRESAGSAGSRP